MNWIEGPVRGWHIYMWIGSILISYLLHVRFLRPKSRGANVELALVNVVGIAGFSGIVGGVMHTFFADEVAQSIGWATGSPFQTEVGFANLAIGVIGYAVFWRRDFLLPAILAKSVFLWGAAGVHIHELLAVGNDAANNAGPVLYWDLFLPMTMLALYGWRRKLLAEESIAPNLGGTAPVG